MAGECSCGLWSGAHACDGARLTAAAEGESHPQAAPVANGEQAPTPDQPPMVSREGSSVHQPSREADTARVEQAADRRRRRSLVGSRRTGKVAVTDFLYGSLLGEGAFARVVHAKHRDSGQEFAIKILDKRQIIREKKRDAVMMERNVMGAARHHNVVRMYLTFQTPEDLFFAIDLCRGTDLFRVIREFFKSRSAEATVVPLPLAQFYMAQCVCALEYLHTRLCVVHRDFKVRACAPVGSGALGRLGMFAA
jgi:serine/threonine protein kinase